MSEDGKTRPVPKRTQNRISTDQIASRFGVQGNTVRRNLCAKGHFLGLRPIKMPNGRLLWEDVYPEDLAA